MWLYSYVAFSPDVPFDVIGFRTGLWAILLRGIIFRDHWNVKLVLSAPALTYEPLLAPPLPPPVPLSDLASRAHGHVLQRALWKIRHSADVRLLPVLGPELGVSEEGHRGGDHRWGRRHHQSAGEIFYVFYAASFLVMGGDNAEPEMNELGECCCMLAGKRPLAVSLHNLLFYRFMWGLAKRLSLLLSP